MQQLIKTLEDFTKQPTGDASPRPVGELGEASIAWAGYCLSNLRGEMLERGLKVSQALAEFDVALQQPEILRD